MSATLSDERLAERLREDTFAFAPLVKIVDKDERSIRLDPNGAQRAFEEQLAEQRAEARPQRIIVLKARQVGISTWTQAKLIQRATLRPNHSAVVIAHDGDTARKLFRMGERMYRALPADEMLWLPDEDGELKARPLKPEVRNYRAGESIHFAESRRDAYLGEMFPDSHYASGTANEFEGGRGSTYHSAHISELAFWARPEDKLTALKSAVPKRPGTLIVIESTANGQNFFKEQWDMAVAGDSDYVPFFWPWWKQEDYRLPFLTEAEHERFARQVGQGRWGADEPDLIKRFGLDLEQLHWRRTTIADEASGRVDKFKQEYPSDPREAFLGTGARVFDAESVDELRSFVILNTDSPTGDPGPLVGALRPGPEVMQIEGRDGITEAPTTALWTPQADLELGLAAPWKLWVPTDEFGMPKIKLEYPPIFGVDVSSGAPEVEGSDNAFHAIQVIDWATGDQLAEYASHIDPDLLAKEIWMAALFFGYNPRTFENAGYVAIERTGGWGGPPIRILWNDYGFPMVYRSRPAGRTVEKQEHRLGWETSNRTKPLLLSYAQELLRDRITGIRSHVLVEEMFTYVRDERGKTDPEPGKFSDRFMAWAIAQFVRKENPIFAEPVEEDD